jgi:hypothetical protein
VPPTERRRNEDFYDDNDEEISTTGNNRLITLTYKEQTYTYTFYCDGTVSSFTTVLMLGAFPVQYDIDGTDVSNIITEPECEWNGSVYISDFSINRTLDEPCPEPNTTEQPTTVKQDLEINTKEITTVETTTENATTKLFSETVQKATIKKVKNIKGKKAIQYSTNKKFKKAQKITTKTLNCTIRKLKKGKKYYFRVKAYKVVNGKTYYGQWSEPKVKKIKK